MGTFNADEEVEDFIVTVKGKEYVLPALSNLTFEQIEQLQHVDIEGGLDEVARIFEIVNEDFAKNGLRQMGPVKLRQMMEQWREEAGVGLGESLPSTAS
jgi:hypothetical protein